MDAFVDLSWTILLLLSFKVSQIANQSGFCQVYSYNIRVDGSSLGERHYFVCCSNADEKSCMGRTYQKPSRTESFCSGDLIKKGGSHFTQMEISAFPAKGRFYCGGCCGQHIAKEACNANMALKQYHECNNWAQCFMTECQKVVSSVRHHEKLDCALPPAPHPKHFRQEPRTLPANFSQEQPPTVTPPPLSPLSDAHNGTKFACTERECNALKKMTRCKLQCCQDYCCLTDGELSNSDDEGWFGFTTIQMIGIAIGILAIITALSGLGVLFVRKCAPVCKTLKPQNNDTQILVIEGPEEADSDQDDDSS